MAKKMPKSKLIVGNGVVCPLHVGVIEKFDTAIVKLDGLKELITNQFRFLDEKITNTKNDTERRLDGTRTELQLMFEKQGVRIDNLSEKLGIFRDVQSVASGGKVWQSKIILTLLALGSSMVTGLLILIVHKVFNF